MKLKKIKYILPLVFVLSTNIAIKSFASEKSPTVINLNQKEFSNYEVVTGKVMKVVNQNEFNRVIIKDSENNITAFKILPYTLITDSVNVLYSLAERTSVSVVYDVNSPVSETNPPQRDAIAIILDGEEYRLLADNFDDNFMSEDNAKKLVVGDNIEIFDNNMTRIEKDELKNSAVIVFYSSKTKNFPSTIIARKVIKLKLEPTFYTNKTIELFLRNLDKEATFYKGEIKYIRLSEFANFAKYTISWNNDEKSIVLNNKENEYKFKINDKELFFNSKSSKLINEPILHDGKTFIPLEFALKIAYEGF